VIRLRLIGVAALILMVLAAACTPSLPKGPSDVSPIPAVKQFFDYLANKRDNNVLYDIACTDSAVAIDLGMEERYFSREELLDTKSRKLIDLTLKLADQQGSAYTRSVQVSGVLATSKRVLDGRVTLVFKGAGRADPPLWCISRFEYTLRDPQ
jgi:hypothetical protein